MRFRQLLIWALLGLLLTPIIIRNGFDVYPDIKDSHHDFSGAAWTNNEICTLCHAPQNTIAKITPLWNHELSTAIYTLYSSSTVDAAIGQPTAQLKLCLSCHDGTVALDNIGGSSGGTMSIKPFVDSSTDLSSHHPISFTYNSALAAADNQLADPSSEPSGLGGTIDEDLLSNGKMQCTSFHGAFRFGDIQGNSYNPLWNSTTGKEGACGTCHREIDAEGNLVTPRPTGHSGTWTIEQCTFCHSSVVNAEGKIIDKLKHINKQIFNLLYLKATLAVAFI